MNKIFNNNLIRLNNQNRNSILKLINNNNHCITSTRFISTINNNNSTSFNNHIKSTPSSSLSNKIIFNNLINESINNKYINRYYSTEKPQQQQSNQSNQSENNNNTNNNNNNNNNNNSNNNNNNDYNDYKEEKRKNLDEKNKTTAMYVAITIIMVLGASYAAVPLYRVFCRVTGFGGTVREADEFDIVRKRDLNRNVYPIKVTFTASTANKIPWSFKPTQSTIECIPGEPVLCFYRATNNTDTPIIGVATYNITPMKAGSYFTKIQCFCFDEQRINAHETIDMPVLFVIEPELLDDKNMKGVTDITLSYTFFKSNDQGELEEI